LSLVGTACNAYGDDLESLTLEVVYETGWFLSSLNGFDGFDRILQMIEFTSKSKILPTTYIRSPKMFFHVLLRLTALTRRVRISSSHTRLPRSRFP
jgi:hypothetical protein